MNTLLNIILFILLFFLKSYAQFYVDSTTQDYIIEFMKIADEHARQNDPSKGIIKLFSDEEIYHIAELYSKCYNDDPVGFQKYLSEKHREWERASLDVTTGKIKMKPWSNVYGLKDAISYKYGVPFAKVIGIPAFIKCKYIKWMYSDYYIVDKENKFKTHNFIFLVEDVLKGNKFFTVGDTVSISMMPNIESLVPNFISGKSYLIPVGILLGLQDDAFNSVFIYLNDMQGAREMGKPPETFPIENEILKNCEYFGIQDTNWTDFKKYFKETYLIFD